MCVEASRNNIRNLCMYAESHPIKAKMKNFEELALQVKRVRKFKKNAKTSKNQDIRNMFFTR